MTTVGKKNRRSVWKKFVPDFSCAFVQITCDFVGNLWLLWKIHLSKSCDASFVWVEKINCVVQLGSVYPHQGYEQCQFLQKIGSL